MGTAAPSERLFSRAGLTLTEKRNKLDPEIVNELVFCRENLSFVRPKTDSEVKSQGDCVRASMASATARDSTTMQGAEATQGFKWT